MCVPSHWAIIILNVCWNNNTHEGLEDYFAEGVKDIEKRYYKSVKRFSGKAFRPSLLKKKVGVKAWDEKEIFKRFDEENTGSISPQQLRRGMKKMFGLTLKPHELKELCREKITPQSKCIHTSLLIIILHMKPTLS